MLRKLMLLGLIFLIVPLVNSQNIGCCCEPVALTGSLMTQADCLALNFQFIGAPPIGESCSEFCNTTLTAPPIGYCGDGICQPFETPLTCPQDCAVIIIDLCTDPDYAEPPQNFEAKPTKGKQSFDTSFSLECPAIKTDIYRCEGDVQVCNNKIITLPSGITTFKDTSNDLKWNHPYTYFAETQYATSLKTAKIRITTNLGDIECWNKGNTPFCITNYFYDDYKNYLETFGYAGSSGNIFSADFSFSIASIFGTKFNKGYTCNNINKLSTPTMTCKDNEFCFADIRGARCIIPDICSKPEFNPFGLFGEATTCEGTTTPRYCFFDKSNTIINKCFSCNPRMQCYDYKSQNTCERDNCGIGTCSWNPIIPSLGIGVCIDTTKSNCEFCNKKGSSTILENFNIHNEILDTCNEEKAKALSTTTSYCFFDSISGTARTCDDITCSDYKTATHCGTPPEGITLHPDNSIKTSSNDPCKIKVCQWIPGANICFKNADGSGIADCKQHDKNCELDYFPPETHITLYGASGRTDYININIFDKKNKKDPPIDMAGKTNYFTHLCIVTVNNTCQNTKEFPIKISTRQLILKNLELKNGQTQITTLSEGNNIIKFFSTDPSKNLEIIKTINITACDNCAGPTLLNVTITGGQLLGNLLYTSTTTPKITFTFDEPTKISFIELKKDDDTIPIYSTTQDFALEHTFSTNTPLTGSFKLTLNGFNQKNIFFDTPLTYTLIADPSTAEVLFLPKDGHITDKTTLNIQLNFTRPVILKTIKLLFDDFRDPYTPKPTIQDITPLLKTNNNQTFSTTISNLKGGRYTIQADATGFNTIQVAASSSFFISTITPGIRLINPSFGITPYSVFNATIETSIPAECKYFPSSVDTPPDVTEFKFLKPFRTTNYYHFTESLTIPLGARNSFKLHAYCNFPKGIVLQTFEIFLDPEPVKILNTFAEPSIIAETHLPEENIFLTTLKIQTNKNAFCKYSPTQTTFEQMQGIFPGYNTIPKESNSVDVNVTTPGTYIYYVSCKGLNELVSETKTITFKVDTNLTFNITTTTPKGFNDNNISIGISANKRSFCYLSEFEDEITTCMGTCTSSFSHYQEILVPGPGKYTYFIKCITGRGEEATLTIPLFVDSTPPFMIFVDDSSESIINPDISWFSNKLRIAFLGNDTESEISHYLVNLVEKENPNNILIDNMVSKIKDGKPFYITTTHNGSALTLQDETTYRFDIRCVNSVGLKSPYMSSDGVKIAFSEIPEHCSDGILSPDETDVDCGGPCDACIIGQSCIQDSDCITSFCSQGICTQSLCNDLILNGLETDVDCGGSICLPCAIGKNCVQNSDCESNYCDPTNLKCKEAPLCFDGKLSPGETDVDCGGPCKGCTEGKNCLSNTDCANNLFCDSTFKVCTLIDVEIPFIPIIEVTEKFNFLKLTLIILLILLFLAATIFFVVKYILTPKTTPPPAPEQPPKKTTETKPKTKEPSIKEEIAKLKDFADQERIENKDWIPLKEIILKKPLPPDRFNTILESLRTIAKNEKIAPKDPLKKLRWMLETLPDELKKDLFAKYQLLKKGMLTKKEKEELFSRLRTTAEYYKNNKEDISKELENYAKRKKKK